MTEAPGHLPVSEAKLRVLYLKGSMGPTGTTRLLESLAEFLDRDLFSLRVVLFNKDHPLVAQTAHKPDVPVEGLSDLGGGLTSKAFCYWRGFSRTVFHHQPDLVMVETLPGIGLTSLWRLLHGRHNFALIARLGADVEMTLRHEDTTKRRRLANRAVSRWLIRRVDKVVVPDSAFCGKLRRRQRVDASQLSVLRNPVHVSTLIERSREPVGDPGIPANGRPLIVAVGRLTPRKRFDHIIRAFALLRSRQDCGLLLLGSGGEEHNLRALAGELRVCEDVTFMGAVTNVMKFVARSTVMAHASVGDGFAYSVAESLACGTPVVCAKESGPPARLIQETGGGLLVDSDVSQFAEALECLLMNAGLRNQLSRNGSVGIQKYDSVSAVREYERLFLSSRVSYPRAS